MCDIIGLYIILKKRIYMLYKSACFTGPRESKMPYGDRTACHERLKTILREQILSLIREGVSDFYTGGQTGS